MGIIRIIWDRRELDLSPGRSRRHNLGQEIYFRNYSYCPNAFHGSTPPRSPSASPRPSPPASVRTASDALSRRSGSRALACTRRYVEISRDCLWPPYTSERICSFVKIWALITACAHISDLTSAQLTLHATCGLIPICSDLLSG